MLTLTKNAIYTNVALTPDGDVWWEGMTDEPPAKCIDWKGQEWTPGCGRAAAHPNARFTVPAGQCPAIDSNWEDPKGVPISAILFGGRRPGVIPLVHQSFSWKHGVFIGSIISSEMTAAAAGKVGELRRDPFAMLPFCGYHIGDYINHWLSIGKKTDESKLPKIFYVNWFRKTTDGKWLWPGYGENSRVLKWVFERTDGSTKAVETPIGSVPSLDGLDTSGLSISRENIEQLLKVDVNDWKKELGSIREHFTKFGGRLPKAIWDELAALETRLSRG